ncbi:hypothetical protein GGS20DRAFT_546096 [Poronia punctata]|nr:hypothetical protein GGS20DRAFT_546096 [Poronia punctata]
MATQAAPPLPPGRLPETEFEHIQLEHYEFKLYREEGISKLRDREILEQYHLWRNYPPANNNRTRFFVNREEKSELKTYHKNNLSSKDIDAQFNALKGYFAADEERPRYVARRFLGSGYFGFTGLFEDRGEDGTMTGREVVIKAAREGMFSDALVREQMMMEKVKNAAHVVQILNTNKPRALPLPAVEIDSSDTEGGSSGDESTDPAYRNEDYPDQKRSRSPIHSELKKSKRKRIDRIKLRDSVKGRQRAKRDILVMEYVQNGTLEDLIDKLMQDQKEKRKREVIPNRILWAFWLCLIRSCIAMEYPPRKFSQHRVRQDGVTEQSAKAKGMWQECKRLGIKIVQGVRGGNGDNGADVDAPHVNLIEDLPRAAWMENRRQNMIHGDITPANVLIGNLEIDEKALEDWGRTRIEVAKKKRENYKPGIPRHSKKRKDRIDGEHGMIPKLQLGDFGQACIVKRRKRNLYYASKRYLGKVGFYPPESFAPEWENLYTSYDGRQIADSRTAGYYSAKSNLWAIAETMWILITGFDGPAPPQPQPPYDEPELLEVFKDNLDNLSEFLEKKDFKISYCPLLMDPRVHTYDHVSLNLRKRIFECMYHKPEDRPSLRDLLDEAIAVLFAEFDGEFDYQIREWVQRWIFDADPTLNSSSTEPVPSPSSQSQRPAPRSNVLSRFPTLKGGEGARQARRDLDRDLDQRRGHDVRLATDYENALVLRPNEWQGAGAMRGIAQFRADFPHGAHIIINRQHGELLCGVHALSDSLRAQLGCNPVVNGVRYEIDRMPTPDDLVAIHAQWRVERENELGYLQNMPGIDLGIQNMAADVVTSVLMRWGQNYGITLGSVILMEGRVPMLDSGDIPNPARYIWIHNDNAIEVAHARGVRKKNKPNYNHYSGMRGNPPPLLPTDDSDLPDFEDDSEDNFEDILGGVASSTELDIENEDEEDNDDIEDEEEEDNGDNENDLSGKDSLFGGDSDEPGSIGDGLAEEGSLLEGEPGEVTRMEDETAGDMTQMDESYGGQNVIYDGDLDGEDVDATVPDVEGSKQARNNDEQADMDPTLRRMLEWSKEYK